MGNFVARSFVFGEFVVRRRRPSCVLGIYARANGYQSIPVENFYSDKYPAHIPSLWSVYGVGLGLSPYIHTLAPPQKKERKKS